MSDQRNSLRRMAGWLWLGLVMLLSACAAPGSGGSSSNAPTLAPAAAPTAAKAEAQPAPAPAVAKPAAPTPAPAVAKAPATPQGTLRHAHPTAPNTFNPHQSQAILLLQYYQLVYETLVTIGPDGKLAPQLATEWKVADKTLTFKLRSGVVFHDGTPFNAAAVVANFKDVKEGAFAPLKNEFSAVDSVQAVDDATVQFNLSAFDPALLLSLTRFAGMQVSPAALKTADKTPVGTGPWTYNAQDSKVDSKYVFDYFPKYWEPGQAGVARVEISAIVEAPTRMNGLQTGEVDTASIGVLAMHQQLETKGFKTISTPLGVTGFHIFDRQGTQVKALADRRVRQALAMSIDREAYYKTLAIGAPLTQRFRPDQLGYVKDLVDLNYNPQRAKALMTEAGVSELDLSIPSGAAMLPFNQAIANFFSNLVVKVKINTIAPGTILPECASGKWAAAFCPMPELHPKTFVENRLLKNGAYNPFKIEDARIEELYAKAKNLPDEQAADLWAQIMKIATEEAYFVFVGGECSACVMVSPKVHGAQPTVGVDIGYQVRGVTVDK